MATTIVNALFHQPTSGEETDNTSLLDRHNKTS